MNRHLSLWYKHKSVIFRPRIKWVSGLSLSLSLFCGLGGREGRKKGSEDLSPLPARCGVGRHSTLQGALPVGKAKGT